MDVDVQAIDEIWNSYQHTSWFRNHPVLSRAETVLHTQFLFGPFIFQHLPINKVLGVIDDSKVKW